MTKTRGCVRDMNTTDEATVDVQQCVNTLKDVSSVTEKRTSSILCYGERVFQILMH